MKIKASLLVLDMNLYPRTHMDEQCIADYVEAMRAGVEFPPVIADKASKRVVDGWKRTTAALRFGGDDAEIEVEWRTYKNKQEVLIDAVHLNATHGERLTHVDVRRCAILCQQLKIQDDQIAAALNMTLDKFLRYAGQTHETRAGDRIPAKRATLHLIDEPLTAKQTAAITGLSGTPQYTKINEVILLIEGNLLDKENEKVMGALNHLYEALQKLLGTVKSSAA